MISHGKAVTLYRCMPVLVFEILLIHIHEVWSIELVMAHRLKQYRTWLIIPAISPYELVIRHLQSDFIRL